MFNSKILGRFLNSPVDHWQKVLYNILSAVSGDISDVLSAMCLPPTPEEAVSCESHIYHMDTL